MRVGSDHHPSGECIILQYDLVNDSGAGLPEPDPVFIGNGRQEIIDFFIFTYRLGQVGLAFILCHDQVIAMHRTGYRYFFAAGGIKLKQGHLGGGILHRHAIRGEIHISFSPFKILRFHSVKKVSIQNFLSQGQGTSQCFTGGIHFGGHFSVSLFDKIKIEYHGNYTI